MFRKLFCIPILTLGWLSYSSVSFAGYCFEQWACVETVELDDKVEFWVVNKKPFPFTASLKVRGYNLATKRRQHSELHKTLVLGDNQRIKAMELYVVNPERPYDYSDAFYWTPGDMNAEHDNSMYHLPYASDKHFHIVQGFGGGYSHRGASRYAVDFAMPVGTPIYAARSGTVIDLTEHNDKGGASRRYAKYANFVSILHSDGTMGEYYHLKQYGVEVELGDTVQAGQLIGYSGNTGFSSLPHLHFAVYRAKSFGNYESLPFRFYQR